MLELLTFDVVLDSPYTHLYHLLRHLGVEDRKELRNVAWAFVNDSQLTTLGLMMPAKDVAIGAIFFAARFTGNEIDDDEVGQPWWAIVGGDDQKIIRAVTVLHDFYTNNPLKKIDAHEGEPPRSPGDLNSTRRRRSVGEDGSSEKDMNMDGASEGTSHKKEPPDESTESRTTRGNDTNPRTDESAHKKEPSDESKTSDESQTLKGDETQPRSTHEKETSYENAWGEPAPKTKDETPLHDIEELTKEDGEVRGDSDAKLKEAANDPATHQQKPDADSEAVSNEQDVANGVGGMHIAQEASQLRAAAGLELPTNGENGRTSVKRKAEDDGDMMEEGEMTETKRPRTGGSEEGELE